MRKMMRVAVVAAGAGLLAGCGGFFDDLANYQAPIQEQQPVQGTDYVAACNTYGCPSTVPVNPPAGACKTSLPDGTFPTTGTACPQ